jgi:hypothetical protein
VGSVGGHDDERDACVVRLEHRRVQVGDGGAGCRDDRDRHPRSAGQTEREEPGAALVDPHVQPQVTGALGRHERVGQWR